VGDGAAWLVRQVEAQFAGQATCLLDFYHLSPYLWRAAGSFARQPKPWVAQQQERLQQNQAAMVVAELAAHLEGEAVADEMAVVRAAWR